MGGNDATLYPAVHFEKEYKAEPNQYISKLKVLKVNNPRTITVRFIVSDMDRDETLGPFKLASNDTDSESSP